MPTTTVDIRLYTTQDAEKCKFSYFPCSQSACAFLWVHPYKINKNELPDISRQFLDILEREAAGFKYGSWHDWVWAALKANILKMRNQVKGK